MRTIRQSSLLVVLVLMAGSAMGWERPIRKADEVARVLRAVNAISRIAASNRVINSRVNPDEATRATIHSQVRQVHGTEQLLRLAQMLWVVLDQQDAADVAYDRVIDSAFWHCVHLLSEDTSVDAARALERLLQFADTDAGYTRMFEEAIAHQKAKRQLKK